LDAFEAKHIEYHLTQILEHLLLLVEDKDALVNQSVHHLDDSHFFKIFAVTDGHVVKDSLVDLLLLSHTIIFIFAWRHK